MEVLRRFKKKMSKTFKMSDLDVLSYYLDIDVQQSTTGITICQGAYAKKLLNTAGLTNSNPTRTPMEVRLQLRKVGTITCSEKKKRHYLCSRSSKYSLKMGLTTR